MPKLPRDVSHDRLIRFLRRHGWVIAREGSRHTVLAKDDAKVSVPRHTILKTGTVSAILKQSGVNERDTADL